jgi:hypothetical protein
MSNDDNTWATVIGTGLLLVVSIAVIIWVYRSEYADCMKQKNDPIICEIYAGRWLSY